MLTDEYGPWVFHDGLGLPVPKGTVVEVRAKNITGLVKSTVSIAVGGEGSAWDWSSIGPLQPWKVIRYRVRKPRGLMILRALITELPMAIHE